MRYFLSVCLVLSWAVKSNASIDDHQSRTFVHLFEWRWTDVANECETYLGPNGYDAIQVSPANEHIDYPSWWARYQPVTFDRFTSFSGTETELRDMIQRCHAAGVKVYADAVINHTADYQGEGTGTAGTPWEIMQHPGLTQEHYHDDCTIQSYQQANEVQQCKLGALPDLDTSQAYVQSLLIDYLNRLAELGFDGARIDAAKHMSHTDLDAILNGSQLDLVFLEVIGDPSAEELLRPKTYAALGAVTDFDYRGAIYGVLEGGATAVVNVLDFSGELAANNAIVFVDNHDTERHTRALSVEQKRLLESLLLVSEYGYPKVLSGYQFENRDQRPSELNVSCGDVWTCWHRDEVVNFFVNQRIQWHDAKRSAVTVLSEDVALLTIGTDAVFINTSSEPKSIEVDLDWASGDYCSRTPNDTSTLDIGRFFGSEVFIQPLTIAVFSMNNECA